MPDVKRAALESLSADTGLVAVDTWIRVLADALKMPQPLTRADYETCRSLMATARG